MTETEPNRGGTGWTMILGLGIYLLVAALLVVWLVQIRSWSVATQGSETAQAEWQRWREEAAREATSEGSVQRRVPVSHEPPILILMRDYFAMSVLATLFFWTALFAPLMWMLHGVLSQSGKPAAPSPPPGSSPSRDAGSDDPGRA